MLPTPTILLHSKHLINKASSMTYARRKVWALANKKTKLPVTKSKKIELFPAITSHSRVQNDRDMYRPSHFSTNSSSNIHTQGRLSSHQAFVPVHRSKCSWCILGGKEGDVTKKHYGHQQKRTFSSVKDDLINPIDKLQGFVNVPLLPPDTHVFNPSRDEVENAATFWTQGMQQMKFLKSAKFQDQLPTDDLPEVTFIGRSNVGKSSLIQAMFIKSDVEVRISKTPGHTKLLNFFEVKGGFRLVDVPGYGFNMPSDYPELVETFLQNRPRLCRTFLLLDGSSGLNKTDMIGVDMVEEFQIPYVFVITKIDKVSPAVLVRNLVSIQKVMKEARHCFPQPFLVSSKTFEGIPLLQTFVAYVTGNLAVEGV